MKATSDKVTKADELVAAAQSAAAQHAIQPLRRRGEVGNGRGSRNDKIISTQLGTSRDYLLQRIARDRPELLSDIGENKRFKSARAAAIEAGIIKDIPSIQLKDPAPTAQKLLTKKGHAWCLQLLEELSELVL